MIIVILLVGLTLATMAFSVVLARASAAARAFSRPRWEAWAMGAITNFFDALGISSFATTLAWMRFRRLVPDRLIPPTLIVGYTVPSLVESLIFLSLLGVRVDPVLLGGCIVAMVAGGLVGARLVTRSPVRLIRAVVAVALAIAGVFMALTNLQLMPAGGHAGGLPPTLTAIVIAAHFLMGVLVFYGVGNFAPTLVLLSLLGMDPRLAFPVMTASAAFCASIAGGSLVQAEARLDLRIVLGMTLGAIPAILIAAFLVKTMPIVLLRWLVVVVVAFAATSLAHSAIMGGPGTAVVDPEEPAT